MNILTGAAQQIPEQKALESIPEEILESIKSLPTEEDLPYDDGIPMENYQDWLQANLLIESLELYWSDRTDYFTRGNMFIYYETPTTFLNPRDRTFFWY